MKTSEKDTFFLQNLLKLLRSFMFLNPMALAYDHVKIIDILTLIPLRITIHFPSFLNLLTNSKVRNTSPKWILGGVITIFESKKETNGKPPSLRTEAALNRRSCSSDSPIPCLFPDNDECHFEGPH